MNDRKHLVAGGDLVDDDAHRQQVMHLLDRQPLGDHLLVDAGDVLGPSADFPRDAGAAEQLAQALSGLLDGALALRAALLELARNVVKGLRLQHPEGQIFQLPFQLPDPQAIGERRKQRQGFASDRLGARALRRGGIVGHKAHRLQARGQAQYDHARIVDHCQQHASKRFGLRLVPLRVGRIGLARAHAFGQQNQLPQIADQNSDRGAGSVADPLCGVTQHVVCAEQVGGRHQLGVLVDRADDLRDAVGVIGE